jgi:hypothetical protein
MNLEAYLPKDYNHVFCKLQDYMLTRNRIQLFSLKMKNKTDKLFNLKKENPKVDMSQKKEVNNIFYPSEKDSLFWCFYVIKNGLMEYQMLQHKNLVFEKKIKIEYVEKMRKNKKIIKT